MFKVYLAGPISGLAYDEAQDWRIKVIQQLASLGITGYSPLRAKSYLREYGKLEQGYEQHPLSSDRGITSRDSFDVRTADAVLFNLMGATSRVSIGTCIEYGWASAFNKPIVTAIEDSGNIHDYPMVREVTGFRTHSLEDAVQIISRILLP